MTVVVVCDVIFKCLLLDILIKNKKKHCKQVYEQTSSWEETSLLTWSQRPRGKNSFSRFRI